MGYIAGVGASAGGLEALERFFKNMPDSEELSFVVVQHLSPNYKSLMAEILAKHTRRAIHVAQSGMLVEGGNIYLIPPKKRITISGGMLQLEEIDPLERVHLPIDLFFHSLAEDQGTAAIGIILSGTGSDGTNGIRSIKEYGGMVVAQDEFSAQFSGMPKSAIYTGLVDFILPPEEMGNHLFEYVENRLEDQQMPAGSKLAADSESLQRIFAFIKKRRNFDLTFYKKNTLLRRLERRINIHRLQNLREYEVVLRNLPEEAELLCNEILIGVTRFFRDKEAFEYLENKVIPSICRSKKEGEDIRIWVAACSTGEEAYSVGILLEEYMRKNNVHYNVKIFATDLDQNAVEFAGIGLYPASIATDVPEAWLHRYFVNSGEYYKVCKELREKLVFATHNMIIDPPFNKTDLITCRNLLIYLQPSIQKKIIGFFDFSLHSNGYLFLGSSETIGEYAHSFELLESRWKIYRHIERRRLTGNTVDGLFMPQVSPGRLRTPERYDVGSGRIADGIFRAVIQKYTVPSVIVDGKFNIVLICGGASQYLLMPEGIPTYRLVDLIAKESITPLMIALRKAFTENVASTYKYKWTKGDGSKEVVNVTVEMLSEAYVAARYGIVQFQVAEIGKVSTLENVFDLDSESNHQVRELASELQYTKESLQAVVEELETSNEELQAANEELLSSNEELQSTNEELQSVNEELINLNSEYQARIQELTELNNDMDNFISSTHIGTVILDQHFTIRKYTPAIKEVIHIMEQDVGRPIQHISHRLKEVDLVADCVAVLEFARPVKKEVRTDNQWFLQSVFPYLTREQQVKGVVITFVNITELKQAQAMVEEMEARKWESADKE